MLKLKPRMHNSETSVNHRTSHDTEGVGEYNSKGHTTSRTSSTQGSQNGDESSPLLSFHSLSMPWSRVFAYGVGHFHNDLCASMWFTYLLLFLTKVRMFGSTNAGLLILIGQLTDAIATPLVGYESDRTNWIRACLKYGKRKSWHLLGTLMTVCSFPFIFVRCLGCGSSTSELVQLVYYVPFVVLFQSGWAAIQISHLALIPELSASAFERITLNCVRYAFTVIASTAVFGTAWYLFEAGQSGCHEGHTHVTPEDEPNFRILAIAVTCVGCFFTFLFHLGTSEPITRRSISTCNNSTSTSLLVSEGSRRLKNMDWSDWFKEHQFYQVAVLYTCTRMFINLSQVYIPLYLLDFQAVTKVYTAIVPLIIYIASFVVSCILGFQKVNRLLSRFTWYLIGAVLGGCACSWMWFPGLSSQMYGVACLLGAANALLLVMSLGMTNDLIGSNTESGAFVFGAMSFSDKLSCGLAIQAIQLLTPDCADDNVCPATAVFYRNVVALVPASALTIAFVCLLTLWPQTVGERRSESLSQHSTYTCPSTNYGAVDESRDGLIRSGEDTTTPGVRA